MSGSACQGAEIIIKQQNGSKIIRFVPVLLFWGWIGHKFPNTVPVLFRFYRFVVAMSAERLVDVGLSKDHKLCAL